MCKVKLTPLVTAEVVSNLCLSAFPRWMLRGCRLLVSSYASPDEHESHLGNTVGSMDWLWSGNDEVRFDKEGLLLQSVYFIVPAHIQFTISAKIGLWQTALRKEGLLRLKTSTSFNLPATTEGWLSPDGTELMCLSDLYYTQRIHSLWRLRIGQDLDLLVANGTFCGWVLSHPLHYLTIGWNKESLETCSENTEDVTFLREYFTLISDSYMIRLESGDIKVLQMLTDLRERVKASRSSPQQKVILHAIEDVLDSIL